MGDGLFPLSGKAAVMRPETWFLQGAGKPVWQLKSQTCQGQRKQVWSEPKETPVKRGSSKGREENRNKTLQERKNEGGWSILKGINPKTYQVLICTVSGTSSASSPSIP